MMLYLSRLALTRNTPVAALAPLLNPSNPGQAASAHHRLIWSVFSDGKDRKRDFLWRHDRRGRFLTLSRRKPKANALFEPPETKVFDPQLQSGDRLQFSLRANATKDRAAISRMEKGVRRGKSRRVDLVMHLMRAAPAGQDRPELRRRMAQQAAHRWMARQGAAKGFRPCIAMAEGYSTIELGRRRRQGATIGVLDICGEIEVTNPATFLQAMAVGFGRAKAWGCGLMLIRRAR